MDELKDATGLRISYFVLFSGSSNSGVGKKLLSQINCWKEQGVIPQLFILTNNRKNSYSFVDYLGDDVCNIYDYSNRIELIIASIKVANALRTSSADLVYMRFTRYLPSWEIFFNSVPFILEMNGNDLIDVKEWGLLARWLYEISRNRLIEKSAGIVSVSRELRNYIGKQKQKKPFCAITNGIALDSFPVLPVPNNLHPRLVFLGNCGYGPQGIDEIMNLAKMRPDWYFDIVGDVTEDWIENTLQNIKFWGRLDREAYEDILAAADVALGPLALYRKGLNSTSAIKVAEYLAFGLPVIVSYGETSFDSAADFILRIPNKPGNVVDALADIEKFVDRWRNERVNRASIKHIDIAYTEKNRLNFFLSVLGNRSGATYV